MDPALLRQREEFKKRATALPTVAKRPAPPTEKKESQSKPAPKKKKTTSQNIAKKEADELKAVTATSNAHFGLLVKIVDHMKKRHLDKSTWALTLDEILDEIQVENVTNKSKRWLFEEALPGNPKIKYLEEEGKFEFKPPHNVKSGSTLLNVLKRYDFEGKGGVLFSELAECVANHVKVVESLGDKVFVVPTKINKRNDKVVFYNDKESIAPVEPDFQVLWRNAAVDHLEEKKIEEYLQKHGIESMKDLAPKKQLNLGPKRKARKSKTVMLNDHLGEDMLQDYSKPS